MINHPTMQRPRKCESFWISADTKQKIQDQTVFYCSWLIERYRKWSRDFCFE